MKTNTRRTFLGQAVGAIAISAAPRAVFGQSAAPAGVEAMTARAVQFLKSRQAADGTWSADRKEPGITALAVTALLRSGRATPAEPAVAKGLGYLETFVKPGGGLPDAAHANYSTAVALMAFHLANTDGRYDAIVKGAQAFLKEKQWDEGEQKTPADPFYGGAGYGSPRGSRPDLSNTTFMLEALHDTGVPADDPAFKKALIFVSRCQNLDSEFNDQPWARKINDGGFIYTAANGGTSVAGKNDDGGLRSYASMTYAGLKSLIYAGLTSEDPRTKAAVAYIARHYTLDENPGLGQRGLYYYYHVFGKALAVLGVDLFKDASGVEHDWRADLIAALAKRQGDSGEWVNKTDGFMEGDANLVTSYGLLAIASTYKKAS